MYSLIPITDEAHRQRAQECLAELETSGRAKARVDRVNDALDKPARHRLLSQAAAASTSSKRVHWLHRVGDVVSQAVATAEAAACRAGCSHCCHIPVMVTAAEARFISQAVGRELVKHPDHAVSFSLEEIAADDLPQRLAPVQADAAKRHVDQPCPFLRDDRCSIYANRPLACRLQFSLADDDFLCRLVGDGAEVSAPYLNTTQEQIAAMAILGPTQPLADIRDWFPFGVD